MSSFFKQIRDLFVRLFRWIASLFSRSQPSRNDVPPTVQFTGSPSGVITSIELVLEYVIIDPNSKISDITIRFSGAGIGMTSATPKSQDPSHSGETGLTSSPSGTTHRFVWDWSQDIPSGNAVDVVVSIFGTNVHGSSPVVTSSRFDLDLPGSSNLPPTIQINQPTGALLQGEFVEIDYKLLDQESDVAYIETFYSTDGGVSFLIANEGNHPGSDGTSNLSTNPLGVDHKFIWHAKRDLFNLPLDVMFRIQSYDSQRGGSASTGTFTVGIAASNHPPEVSILSPMANTDQGMVVEMKYRLKDDNSDLIRIDVRYSTDNGLTFQTASEALGFNSEGLNDLSSDPTGVEHSFFWNAEQDLASLPANNIIIQIQAFDSMPGSVASVGSLNITNNYPPLIQIFSPTANSSNPSPVTIEYVLTDREGDTCELDAFYSLDDGDTYRSATSHSSGDGTTQIVSSPSGEVRQFAWDAERDLNATSAVGVLIKIQVKDQYPGGISVSDRFDVGMAVAPGIKVLQPTTGVWGNPLPIIYELFHPNTGQQVQMQMEFSLDNGQNYDPVTEVGNLGSEGLIDLLAEPNGVRHFFAWDAEADIPSLDTDIQKNVKLRLKASHASEVGTFETDLFDIDAGYLGIASNNILPGSPIRKPRVVLFDPADHTGIHVITRFLLHHPDNFNVNVNVEFKVNNEPYRPATPAHYSDQLTNLQATDAHMDYQFVWNAKHDLDKLGLTSGTVQLRFTPYFGIETGQMEETAIFNFTIENPTTVQPIPPKTRYNSLSLAIIEGNNQEIIPGQLGAKDLVVELRDALGEVVRNARITFSSGINSQVQVALETHPTHRTTTDFYGRAGIRVRPEKGVEGNIEIRAHVVGMPAISAVFNLTSKLPKIVLDDINPAQPYEYGKTYAFGFYFDSQTDLGSINFNNDAFEPIEFKVTAANAETTTSRIRFPGPNGSGNYFWVYLTPSLLGGTSTQPSTDSFSLKVEVLNMPDVQAFDETYSIQTDTNARHLLGVQVQNNGFGPADYVYEEKRLHMKVLSGHDPADPTLMLAQTGYPGLTLSTPFQVKVVDDQGVEYNETTPVAGTITQPGSCDLLTIAIEPMKISWRATGGVLSTSPTKGTQDSLDLFVDEKVYFTPTASGPWSVNASVINFVHDKSSTKKPYGIKRQTGSGSSGTIVRDPYCAYHPGFYTAVRRTFYIHDPETVGLEDLQQLAAGNPGVLLNKLKSGIKSRFLVSKLSPFTTSSVPEKVKLKCVLANNAEVIEYAGATNLDFKQEITLTKDSQDNSILRSTELLFVQNESRTSSGTPVSILPQTKLRAEVAHLKLTIKTAGLERERLRYGAGSVNGDTEYAYESPVNTSPLGGVNNSVYLHSREFNHVRQDLAFPSRTGLLSIIRHYRSQVLSNSYQNDHSYSEPIGPGWFLESMQYVEVGHRHLRWWDGTGGYFDFPFQYVGKGVFAFITLNDTITADQSAVEIRDKNRNTTHFNIDGTVRFYKDRFGNKYTYEYSERGQLIKIRDCIAPADRYYQFDYYDDSDANIRNKRSGKISKIFDFDGRTVDFEYYEENETDGGAGHLKKVTWPEATSLLEGKSNTEKFRNYEVYKYKELSPERWVLDRIVNLNSKGNERNWLTNHYQNNELVKQENLTRTHEFKLLSGNRVELTDPELSKSTYDFPDSPFWDAVTPNKIVDTEGYTTELRHNNHGHLVYLKPPEGGESEYVYDEDSNFARRRDDLLAIIRTSATGKVRKSIFTYSGRFHQPLTSVPSEGNEAGVDPNLFTTISNYDHQRGQGDAGNVVDISEPRKLVMTTKAVAGDKAHGLWIEENPKTEYTYNSKGLVTSEIDPKGIKTLYRYYPESDPYGKNSTPAEGEGGFLGEIIRDSDITARRQLHLPDTPLATSKVTYKYDDRGYPKEIKDDKGRITEMEFNELGENIKVIEGKGVKGLDTIEESFYGPNGELNKTTFNRPQTGTNKLEKAETLLKYNDEGFLDEKSVTVNGEVTKKESYEWYPGGDLKKSTNEAEESEFKYDTRGLVKETKHTRGGVTTTTTNEYTKSGRLKEMTNPAGDTTKFEFNDYGEPYKEIDPSGAEYETILNAHGESIAEIKATQGTVGKTYAITEFVKRNLSDVRRIHHLHFDPTAGTRDRKVPKLPEFGGIGSRTYLPNKVGQLPSSKGRLTEDIFHDISGNIIQQANHESNYERRLLNAQNSVVEFSDAQGNKIENAFDEQTREFTKTYEAKSNDPLEAESHTYKSKFKVNEAHQIIQETDNLGNTFRFEYDDAGRLLKFYDARGSESTDTFDGTGTPKLNNPGNATTFGYDKYGHLVRTELTLTEDGQAGANTDQSNPYNPDGKIKEEVKYDDKGRLIEEKDNEGYVTKFKYKGDSTILEKVEFPGTVGTGGTVDNPGSGSPSEESITYDGAGRIETVTDRNGTRWRYVYENDLLKEVNVEQKANGVMGTEGFEYKYDDAGNLIQVIDKSDSDLTMGWKHDSFDNLLEQSIGAFSVHQEYNENGQLKREVYPDGSKVNYDYDSETGLLDTVKEEDDLLSKFHYLGRDRIKSYTSGTQKTIFSHDEAGNFNEMRVTDFDGGNELKYVVNRNRMNQIEDWELQHPDGTTEKYKNYYDSAGRLIQEEYFVPSGQPVASLSTLFLYDADHVLRELIVDEIDTNTQMVEKKRYLFKRQAHGDTVEIVELPFIQP